MFRFAFFAACVMLLAWMGAPTKADSPKRFPLKTLDDHFPFEVPKSVEAWQQRQYALRTRVAVATGMHPMLPRGPVKITRHSPVERDGFRFEKFYFESVPGHFVTGLLFLPTDKRESTRPAVLSPHGHGGRLMRYNNQKIAELIESGDEKFVDSGRRPKLARCAHLARMGCVVMIFDMVGYADSIQLDYQLAHRRHGTRDGETIAANREPHLFFSTPAESRLQSILGLQTYNLLRAFDCLASLPEVDADRVAVTGGSGGGTQSILLGALEPRVAASFPNGMVSTSMQGGCACENANLLRIGAGNVELAALMAPRPMAMTAADDWTRAMMTDGYPQLRELYSMLGADGAVECTPLLQFKHNYNLVTRGLMYRWMNQHLKLGAGDRLEEIDFPEITDDEIAVWNDEHPEPTNHGRSHESEILTWWNEQSISGLSGALGPKADPNSFDQLVRPAIETIFDCKMPVSQSVRWETNGEPQSIDQWNWQRGWVVDTNRNRRIAAQRWCPRADPGAAGNVKPGNVKIWVTDHASVIAPKPIGLPDSLTQHTADPAVIFALGEAEDDLAIECDNENNGNLAGWRQQPVNPQPRRTAAAFTFGYNQPLGVRRTADILASVTLAHSNVSVDSKRKDQTIHIELHAEGPLAVSALAASALAGSAIDHAFIRLNGFRYGDIRFQSDEQFIPGMVKYGDVDSLAAMRTPFPLTLVGETTKDFSTATALYSEQETADDFQCMIDFKPSDQRTSAAKP